MTYGTTTYWEIICYFFLFSPSPPWALLAGPEPLPAGSELLPSSPACFKALPAGSKASSTGFQALLASSEALSGQGYCKPSLALDRLPSFDSLVDFF